MTTISTTNEIIQSVIVFGIIFAVTYHAFGWTIAGLFRFFKSLLKVIFKIGLWMIVIVPAIALLAYLFSIVAAMSASTIIICLLIWIALK
jgi:hypothetical protein